MDLFEAYCQDKKPAASTINRWRAVFTTLDTVSNWQAPGWDAQQWLDSLKTVDRSARTVRDVWLSAARTVCRWAVRKKRLGRNPFVGCTVEVPKVVETRETGRAFTETEATTILRAAAAVTVLLLGQRGWQWSACRRWVPWLAAYSGARAGELTQLRASDVERRECGVVIRITPEAGTVKTGKVRVVPVHADIADEVFAHAKTVEARYGPTAPLFHTFPATTVPRDTVARL
jgi:integrase